MEIQVGSKYMNKTDEDPHGVITVTKVTDLTVFYDGEPRGNCQKPTKGYCRKATFEKQYLPLVEPPKETPKPVMLPVKAVMESPMGSGKWVPATLSISGGLAVKIQGAIDNSNFKSDVKEFKHNGVKCLMMKHPHFGTWCGYAQIPHGSVDKKIKNYTKVAIKGVTMTVSSMNGTTRIAIAGCRRSGYVAPILSGIEVHGGLTFYGIPRHRQKYDGRRWLGFDCAHAGDAIPGFKQFGLGEDPDAVFADESYVEGHCRKLADQLIALNKELAKK